MESTGLAVSEVHVGFDGKYKVGSWTPVWMTITGSEQTPIQVDLVVNDADGVPARFVDVDPPVAPTAKGKWEVIRYAKFGRLRSGLKVEVRIGGNVVSSRSFTSGDVPSAEPNGSELVVTVGKSLGIEETFKQRRGKANETVVTPLVDSVKELPDRWWGYEGVDNLCWAGSEAKLVAELSGDQLLALETWIRLGGKFLLSVGAEGQSILGASGQFARFNPGRFVEVVEQKRTADLERYANASQPMMVAGQAVQTPLKLSVLADLPFREEASEGTGLTRHPTVIRYPLGLGQVTLVMVDLDAPAIVAWPERTKLVARLLEMAATNSREENVGGQKLGQLTHLGFDDLGGQLRAALDQFPEAPPFSFSWVAGLLVVYILLIGPADYFFLRRVTGRMELTWVTLPLIILGFCSAAVVLANSWKGNDLRLNQVDLVDIDVETRLARGTSWANLYTPRSEEFNLEFVPNPPFQGEPAAALIAWQGLAGKGLGGMESGPAGSLFSRPYEILRTPPDSADPARLSKLPIEVSGTKSLLTRSWMPAELPSVGQLAADLDGRLQGELINPLRVEMLDAVLFHENSAYKLKAKLSAGERLVLTSQSPVMHIERRLTQRRIMESGETKTAWNPESFDVPRILEMMMFHDAAGGRAYTGLSNRQEAFVDLSGHLRTGRAVLMARAETPAGELKQDGQPVAGEHATHYTFYRLVIPVGKRTK